ncbi:MAG: rane protein, partial [Phycisphaerales bacterium]|nr:rane protein [Phycisphaerales bacterium]
MGTPLAPSTYKLLADALVAFHFAFVAFVIGGGLLVLWRRRAMWLHLPAVAWGIWIETSGGICPLTPIENGLRLSAGEAGYEGGFVDHYIMPVLYPAGLTRNL